MRISDWSSDVCSSDLVFGARMCDVASRTGAEVVRVDFDWGTPVVADRLLDAHPSPTLIGMVHAETSTGARSDVEPVAAGKGDGIGRASWRERVWQYV